MLTRISILLSIVTLLTLVPAVARPEPPAPAQIADFRLPDHLGKEHALADFADHDFVVVAFLGTECPLAKLYAGRLQTIADEYAERGVAVVAVMSNAQDSLDGNRGVCAAAQPHVPRAQRPPQRGGRSVRRRAHAASVSARSPAHGPLPGTRRRSVPCRCHARQTDSRGLAARDRRAAGRQVGVGFADRLARMHHRSRSQTERRQLGHVSPRHRADLASSLRRMSSRRRNRAVRTYPRTTRRPAGAR